MSTPTYEWVNPPAPTEAGVSLPLLDMQNIYKVFNTGTENETVVLDDCTFVVQPGEFVSIVGQSGSGKSTLMNIIGLLDTPTAGYYHFAGANIATMREDDLAYYRSTNIGFIFQNFNLIGRISALKNVEMPMMYAGVPPKERTTRAKELLAEVDMAERATYLPGQLSGGQKQRVAIARALANNPPLILADEPTGALDSATGRAVMDLFHRLNKEQGKSIVFITHNPELAAETDRIVNMADGKLSESAGEL